MERRTEAELAALTSHFQARLTAGDSLDDILVEAFAAIREVAKRTVDMRPFDVQLIGGIVLHQGKVAEMKTGEGKTLVATMPVYLNALLGRGVHLVTVNDYLARRDTLWMGPIYHLMGLSIGLLQSGADQPAYLYDPDYQRDPYPGLRPVPRQEAYRAHITYGTNNEFGFDYLRDNLALTLERRVQRPLYYAIVDEVDNIFIDEARTPLIISGPSDEPVEEYSQFAVIARKFEPGVHYELDDKERSVYLTEEGLALVEQETGIENIYDEANYRYVHYMQQALKAQVLFLEGRDYIRQRKQIILIDQHTGRLMPSRRLSEGLHQAIEAKEAVPIRPRDVTSATITIQNYFRMYEKLAGMSGTAVTEAEEFFKIYNLDVMAIPTNKPVARIDHADVVYRTEEAKLRAVAREIIACHSLGQPVLVGTTSVDMSERLSKRLDGDRLQMAAIAPRVAYALQDTELSDQERAAMREVMNDSLETINLAAWRRMVRNLDLNPNALTPENLEWIGDYMELPRDPQVRHNMERALREGIPHEILNAKEHTREAAIIARAGEPGAVTIATNMAGRGVDIKLGGELSDEVIHRAHQALEDRGLNPFSATPAQMDSAIAEVAPQYAKRREHVLRVNGLHVLGTERHEARRIDNQLRGRSGRQGEPGSSRFYLSLEDDLMRRFGRKEMLSRLMETIGDDFPIEHGLVSKTIERAQTSVEGYNFDIRKHLLEYDDVLNRQRDSIYGERLRIIKSDDLRPEVWRMLEGQVDEYLQKYVADDRDEEGETQQRLLFAGLDDVVPLILPSPKSPFQGPLPFGSHLTAFPPFTITFLADQLAGQPEEEVRQTLGDLNHQAAAIYGDEIHQSISSLAQTTRDSYEERLDRYRALLDEKIEDYLQLIEERGQPLDARRLAQHLERTYPLKLTMPLSQDLADMEGLDDLRDHWLAEVEEQFHQQTCATLIDRAQGRLPLEAADGLARFRAARIPPARLADELARVKELAGRQPRDQESQREMERLALESDPDPSQVLTFVNTVKESSKLDYSRLDRLVGHALGAYLDDLAEFYLSSLEEEQGRLKRDLERLQTLVIEGRGRASNLVDVLQELNNLVNVEISTLEEVLDRAVSHEYDKWAQRQLTEIEADARRHKLSGASWSDIGEHLLATHYTERQAYDRGHRRQTTWLSRLPLSLVAQAQVEGLDAENLRREVMDSLAWALDQREQVWGKQELQQWSELSLDDLDQDTYDGLLRYLGGQDLADLRRRSVDELPPELYDRLRFVLAWRRLENKDPRLGELAQADRLLDHMGTLLEQKIMETPVGQLDGRLQEAVLDQLRASGYLDDPAARSAFLQRPIADWDEQTVEEGAMFWGRRFIRANQEQPIVDLPPQARDTAVDYFEKQRRFVDEERVQRFLVHERLTDLPAETQRAALQYLAQTRLERMARRKISNIDVTTRQVVTDSLQRLGLFTDETHRDELKSRTLGDLAPKVKQGFARALAAQKLGGRSVNDLEGEAGRYVIDRLKEQGILAAPERVQKLETRRLSELDGEIGDRVREALISRLGHDLETRTMEELPAGMRRQVHQALNEHDYFVDREKVGWYERKTLAQLPSELLQGLEQKLGGVRLAQVVDVPFRELPAETQNEILEFLDRDRLLADRAERLRLTQVGTLAELDDEVQERVALHLGRQWLVSIRDRRPPDLPPRDRQLVWTFLRDRDYFADEFKEELFAFQRLDEFDAETQQAVEANLVAQMTTSLESIPVAELPSELHDQVRARLRQADYFVDEDLLRQIQNRPLEQLEGDLPHHVTEALAGYLLSRPSDLSPAGQPLNAVPVADLPGATRDALWRYLDEIGYLVNEEKQKKMLDRRLIDLSGQVYETIVRDLVAHLEAEIGDHLVSDLDEELRQGLREALEALGFFESDEVRARVVGQILGSLRREDLDALASALGHSQRLTYADQRPADLPPEEQDALLAHLQAREWFLDRARLDRVRAEPLRELDAGRELVDALKEQHRDRLRQQRLSNLDPPQLHSVRAFLQQQGLAAEESEMRPLRHQPLEEIDRDVYYDLLRDLGGEVIADWSTDQFQDLPAEEQALMSAYLGRRIMGRIERRVLLHTISRLWIDYLTDIEDLRRGIGLEAYGQRDPLVEYKRRAFELFEELGDNIRRTVVRSLFRQPPEPLAQA
jgi:preprotein translocase subunit SecA